MVVVDSLSHNHELKQLRENGTLNIDVKKKFMKLTLSEAVKKLDMLHNNAMMQSSDLNQRYTLFFRVVNLCELVLQRSDLSQNKWAPDRVTSILKEAVSILERLTIEIKQRSQSRQLLDDRYEAEFRRRPSPVQKDRERSPAKPTNGVVQFDTYITPFQLVKYVELHNKPVLIIDFRTTHSPAIKYEDKNLIQVMVFEERYIDRGISYNTFYIYVDIHSRFKLNNVNTYGFVVLMGDELSEGVTLSDQSRTMALRSALAEHLSQPPLLLQGGFAAFERAYPIYVERPSNRQLSFEGLDPFTALLERARAEIPREFCYPDLSDNPKPVPFPTNEYDTKRSVMERIDELKLRDRKSPSPARKTSSRSSVKDYAKIESTVRRDYTVGPKSSVSSDTISRIDRSPVKHSSSNFSISASTHDSYTSLDERRENFDSLDRPLKQKPRPIVDRTKKPHLEGKKEVTEFPVEQNAQPKSYEEKIERNIEVKLNGETNLNGGARIDTTASQSTTLVHPRPSHRPRPPTPDRSTKKLAPEIEQRKKTLRDLFVYTVEDIRKHQRTMPCTVPPGCTGLFNMGNTCFMNATLQALFNTPNMRHFFSEDKFLDYVNVYNKRGTGGVMASCFSAMIVVMWSGNYKAISTLRFTEVFSKTCPDLCDGQQHDAQEFLVFLLDALHEDTIPVMLDKVMEQNYDGLNIGMDYQHYVKNLKSFRESPIMSIFNLTTANQIHCGSCNTGSLTFAESTQIMLELPMQSSCHITQCLQSHFRDLILDGSSAWNCPRCERKQRSRVEQKVWVLPPVLVILLKRVKQNMDGTFEKNTIGVDFDIHNLDMAPYMHQKAAKQNSKYRLYAITNHSGTMNSGHYTAFVKNQYLNKWLKFDDDYCNEVSEHEIKTEKAFILFYTNDTRLPPSM
ncbi:unnamed protein product [Bursaphelenchus okinawaensis]|uniref:Ubiquitin carboxyl-terminal hydrolase n=1 Tax=Bursaphelenchus okinawaensis TaxID=465554 RepID=A0A811L8B2_9BILA|nr:unnamed protein product [Bursaphelenchus okinawaensis]CAG9119200.1 unnamed protein product [Bursaphelenchus okinawaensis]